MVVFQEFIPELEPNPPFIGSALRNLWTAPLNDAVQSLLTRHTILNQKFKNFSKIAVNNLHKYTEIQ